MDYAKSNYLKGEKMKRKGNSQGSSCPSPSFLFFLMVVHMVGMLILSFP
jgi:hypothetical protein